MTLVELYDWVCRAEEEFAEIKSAFPEVLAADRNRLVMSFSCARVSLEVRIKPPRMKAARGSYGSPGPRGADQGLTSSNQ